MNTKPDCMRPGCDRVADSRGLCRPDYIRAAKLVRDGRTTWEDLEARGRALSKGSGSITRWFLDVGESAAKPVE